MKIYHSLYSKLALALISLLILVGLFYLLASQSLLEQSYQSSNQQLNRELAINLAQEMKLVKEGQVDLDALNDAFHILMLVNPSIEIYYLNQDGYIVEFFADPEKLKRSHVDLEPIHKFLANDSMYPLVGDDPRNQNQTKSFSVAALPNAENLQGYLYVVLQGTNFDYFQSREQSQVIQKLRTWSLLGSLVIGLLLGLALFYWLTKRIRRLNRAIDLFRENGYSTANNNLKNLRISDQGKDEISQLSRSFDSMSKHINEQYLALQTQDALRRDMVANISHDLRTPLAAVHGYTERLRDKFDELSIEERKKFLDISLYHSNRLNHLINDLFELSKLDASEVKPNLEPFSLGELVQDVLQKFRLNAENRKIELSLKHHNHLPLVNGDIALLDRAISNLVDNAISHTAEGGKISLTLETNGDRVSIQVQDNGVGIEDSHLSSIFQRFYRANNEHRSQDKHAGLGLAITHRILELHGQAINVISKVGHGTTFQFFMPISKNSTISH